MKTSANFSITWLSIMKIHCALLTQIAKIALKMTQNSQMTSSKISKKHSGDELGLVLVVHRMQMVLQAYPDYRNSFFLIFIFVISQISNFFTLKYFFEFSGGDDQLSSNELKPPTRNETLLIRWLIIPMIRVIQQLFFWKRFWSKKIEEEKRNTVSKFSSGGWFQSFFHKKYFCIFLWIYTTFEKFKLETVPSKKSKNTNAPRSKNMFIDFGFWTGVWHRYYP